MLPCFSFGQKKDSLLWEVASTKDYLLHESKWKDATKAVRGNQLTITGVTTSIPKQDTIPVIILCSDTSAKWINGEEFYNASVEWRFGYEVRSVERRNNYEGITDPGFYLPPLKYEEWNIYSHVAYLDGKKNLMPNKIMVWQSKEIK